MRRTLRPENIQQRPELFWSCIDCWRVSTANVFGTGMRDALPLARVLMLLFCICADVLGDAACLAGSDICMADIVEQ